MRKAEEKRTHTHIAYNNNNSMVCESNKRMYNKCIYTQRNKWAFVDTDISSWLLLLLLFFISFHAVHRSNNNNESLFLHLRIVQQNTHNVDILIKLQSIIIIFLCRIYQKIGKGHTGETKCFYIICN